MWSQYPIYFPDFCRLLWGYCGEVRSAAATCPFEPVNIPTDRLIGPATKEMFNAKQNEKAIRTETRIEAT